MIGPSILVIQKWHDPTIVLPTQIGTSLATPTWQLHGLGFRPSKLPSEPSDSQIDRSPNGLPSAVKLPAKLTAEPPALDSRQGRGGQDKVRPSEGHVTLGPHPSTRLIFPKSAHWITATLHLPHPHQTTSSDMSLCACLLFARPTPHPQHAHLHITSPIELRTSLGSIGSFQKGIDQANEVLSFVHAGKSRSVTIVLAYLIHRYRWSLKKAYAHVSERRAGICTNIRFLAKLMSFEQRKMMPKTHSVLGPHRANSICPGKSGLLGHLKSARLVSHHYLSSSSTSTSVSASVLSPKRIEPHSPRPHPDHQQHQHQAEEEGGHGEAFAAYSFGQKPLPPTLLRARPPPTKSYSLDLDRSHCFRVRSLAVAAKTDSFAPPLPPSQPPRDNLANLDNRLLVSPDRASPRSVFSRGPRDSLGASPNGSRPYP
ncbi:hypothetical protein PTTG_06841 [Puccinia triticina 1-1 BBBD Race 1]|uniref:protein-tyrosine-phosphatase n=1 Tax=Puccinia triticina (isolate 1-1 / race 1 (BBBD)) TaxID=630390 RepID=A0A180H2K1_PUCT1|nr:hypothetical protein PTTG_06841 [Puccinia triticina 1-1 BBBD Race 1]